VGWVKTLLPSRVGSDVCLLADRWTLDYGLAAMFVRLEHQAAREMGRYWPGLYIISGQRDPAHNADVGGVPGSFHTACPSLAGDLRVGRVAGLASNEVMAILGGMWRLMGGRWGGTFRDPSPNHFDIGGV